jgi:hypothetical protein
MAFITNQFLKGDPERNRTHDTKFVTVSATASSTPWEREQNVVASIEAQQTSKNYQYISITEEELHILVSQLFRMTSKAFQLDCAKYALKDVDDAGLVSHLKEVLKVESVKDSECLTSREYNPESVFRLLCAIYGEKYDPEYEWEWLKTCTPESLSRVKDVLHTLTEEEQEVLEKQFLLNVKKASPSPFKPYQQVFPKEHIEPVTSTALRKLRHPTRLKKIAHLFKASD